MLLLYVGAVFIAPLYNLTPSVQNNLVQLVHMLVQPADDTFFKEYIGLLQEGNVDKAYSFLAPEAKQTASIDQMRELSEYFAKTTDQMEVVAGGMNMRSNDNHSTTTYDVYYEIGNNDDVYKYVMAEITAQKIDDKLTILGVHTTVTEKSIKEQPRFDLASQGIYLLLALLIPAFIAFTAFRYITTAEKPTWPIFLIILFIALYFSATNGNYKVNFGFYGFMVPTGPWAPFMFLMPVPLGALYYWYARWRGKY